MQTAHQSGPVRYAQHDWSSPAYRSTMLDRVEVDDNDLPKDPRSWNRDDVAHWLNYTCQQHSLPEVSTSRFLMNGKALCLMTPGMFLNRVPIGGKLLYKDFQLRLCAAMYNI